LVVVTSMKKFWPALQNVSGVGGWRRRGKVMGDKSCHLSWFPRLGVVFRDWVVRIPNMEGPEFQIWGFQSSKYGESEFQIWEVQSSKYGESEFQIWGAGMGAESCHIRSRMADLPRGPADLAARRTRRTSRQWTYAPGTYTHRARRDRHMGGNTLGISPVPGATGRGATSEGTQPGVQSGPRGALRSRTWTCMWLPPPVQLRSACHTRAIFTWPRPPSRLRGA
jgi:hypothetical protein